MFRVKYFMFCKKTSSLAIHKRIHPTLKVVSAEKTNFGGLMNCTLADGRNIEIPEEALVSIAQ